MAQRNVIHCVNSNINTIHLDLQGKQDNEMVLKNFCQLHLENDSSVKQIVSYIKDRYNKEVSCKFV